MFLRIIVGLAIWGGLLFVAGAIFPKKRRDPAWLWVSLMTLLWVVVLLIYLILQIFSIGYLLPAFMLATVFLAVWFEGYFGSRWLAGEESVDGRER
jgi:hypothetical protein